jgi:sulfide:quinone oxidoreductase
VTIDDSSKPSVLIVGGGIAGLEAALALADLAGERADVAMLAPEPDFLYKPLTVEEPFTHQPAERRELAPALATIGVGLIRGGLRRVAPGEHTVTTTAGQELAYDTLVVCVGGKPRPAYEGVESFWSHRADLPVDDLIRRARTSFGGTMILIVPPDTSWSLPLYELALLFRKRTEELGLGDLRLRFVTPEPTPLAVFGTAASTAIADLFAARRISIETNRRAVQDTNGAIHLAPQGLPLGDGVIVSLPVIEGPAIPGLPYDPRGFMPVDEHGRVEGVDDVYAAGDGTDFPVKQGGLATQQADAAAEHIAAALGADLTPAPFKPVLRGQLITGAESLNLRHGLTGGQGEGSASLDYLWWPPQKVAGRYLSAWLGHTDQTDLEPPSRLIDVEVSWPHEWHGVPMTYDAEVAER